MSNHDSESTPYEPRRAPAAEDATISLLDLLAVIVKRRWLIIGITGVAAVVIVGLLALSMKLPVTSKLNFFPDKYKPTASILLQAPSQSSSLSSLLGNTGLGSLSSLLGTGTTIGGTSADLVTALLKSNSILDTVAGEFDVVGRLHITKQPRAASRAFLMSGLKTKVDSASGIMQIGFEDPDREFATKVVNRLVELVGNEFTDLSVSKLKEKETYLSDQLALAESEAAVRESKLLAFQNAHGIYNVDQQAAANIQTVAALQARIVTMQIDLRQQSKVYPDTDYRIVQLKDSIKETQNEIDSLTRGTGTASGSVSQSQLMSLSAQYQGLLRDVTVQQAIVSTIQTQYSAAHVDELTKQQAFQVVDRADVPEVRSSPQRTKTAVIVTLVAGVLSVLLAFVLEYFDRAKLDPVEAAKLQSIRDSLSPRRKLPR